MSLACLLLLFSAAWHINGSDYQKKAANNICTRGSIVLEDNKRRRDKQSSDDSWIDASHLPNP